MLCPNLALSSLAICYTVPWSTQHYIKVHTIDADARVVLDAQVNVLLNTKPKVASVREIVLVQLVLSHLQPFLKDLLCLCSTHSAVNSNLFIAANSKGTHSEPSYTTKTNIVSKCDQRAHWVENKTCC